MEEIKFSDIRFDAITDLLRAEYKDDTIEYHGHYINGLKCHVLGFMQPNTSGIVVKVFKDDGTWIVARVIK